MGFTVTGVNGFGSRVFEFRVSRVWAYSLGFGVLLVCRGSKRISAFLSKNDRYSNFLWPRAHFHFAGLSTASQGSEKPGAAF